MANLKGIATGAVLGTVLGSLAIILYPKRQEIFEAVLERTGDFPERAREYADMILNNRKNKTVVNGYLTSGLAGLFLGAGVALALAPKTGKQFRTQFAKAYNELFGKTQSVAHFFRNNSHPIHAVMRPKKKAKRVLKTRHPS